MGNNELVMMMMSFHVIAYSNGRSRIAKLNIQAVKTDTEAQTLQDAKAETVSDDQSDPQTGSPSVRWEDLMFFLCSLDCCCHFGLKLQFWEIGGFLSRLL